MSLTKEQKDEICTEIDTQWECHLMTRAIFDSQFPNRLTYQSAQLYRQHGLNFHVEILNSKSDQFLKSSKRVAVWLNQNYVIRLYGILDQFLPLDKYSKDEEVIALLRMLRNNIGAHSMGKQSNNRKKIVKATQLINKLFGRNISEENVLNYTLSVDSVLLPLKEQIKSVVRNIEVK